MKGFRLRPFPFSARDQREIEDWWLDLFDNLTKKFNDAHSDLFVDTSSIQWSYDPTEGKYTASVSTSGGSSATTAEILQTIANNYTSTTGMSLAYDAVNNRLLVNYFIQNIDHDQLLNFVANEHIDWTNATQNLSTSGSLSTGGGIQFTDGDHTADRFVKNDASGNLSLDNQIVQADVSDVTATASEINQVLSGVAGTVTAANLGELTDGSTTVLHSHVASITFVNTSTVIVSPLTGDSFSINVVDAGVDHDQLLNFDEDEHIDWTNAQDKELKISYSGDSDDFVRIEAGSPVTAAIQLSSGAGESTAITPGDISISDALVAEGSARIGSATNNVTLNPDYGVLFNGTTTVWEDVRVPGNTVVKQSTGPDDINPLGNLEVLGFADNATESVSFSIQLPHSYKLGSTIYPHVHWMPISTNTGDVRWGLEYSWADYGTTFPSPTTIYVNDTAGGVANEHQFASFPSISAGANAGQQVSSMLICRLFREGGNAADTHSGDAAFLEFDIHIEIDTFGSRTELAK